MLLYRRCTHSQTPHTSADLVRVSCHTDTRSDTHSHTIDTRHSVTALGHAACAPTHLSGAPPAMSGPAPLTDRPPSPLTHQPVRHADTVTVFARGGSAGSQAEVRELFDLTGKREGVHLPGRMQLRLAATIGRCQEARQPACMPVPPRALLRPASSSFRLCGRWS